MNIYHFDSYHKSDGLTCGGAALLRPSVWVFLITERSDDLKQNGREPFEVCISEYELGSPVPALSLG